MSTHYDIRCTLISETNGYRFSINFFKDRPYPEWITINEFYQFVGNYLDENAICWGLTLGNTRLRNKKTECLDFYVKVLNFEDATLLQLGFQ